MSLCSATPSGSLTSSPSTTTTETAVTTKTTTTTTSTVTTTTVTVQQTESERRRRALGWVPSSMRLLEEAERRLLAGVKYLTHSRYIPVLGGSARLWTVTAERPKTAEKMPLVLVHGFGAGTGLWVGNLDALAHNRPTHAFDLLGFAQSSRIDFGNDPDRIEAQWVNSIEDWRKQLNLQRFILLGHSLGGFVASIQQSFGWAKNPMLERFHMLPRSLPVTFVYGMKSWVDSGSGYKVKHELLPHSYVDVEVIENAGHHVYIDQCDLFNDKINYVTSLVDSGSDVPDPSQRDLLNPSHAI